MKDNLNLIYGLLFEAFGEQNWWPGEGEFEMMVGAILTQNTAWTNVEKALSKLPRPLTLDAVERLSEDELCEAVRPCGYFRQKTQRIFALCAWCREYGHLAGDFENEKTETLREKILALKGVGPETADSILLYAWGRAIFVIDAYTRRVMSRVFEDEKYLKMPYDEVAQIFHANVEANSKIYNEYHALIVKLCKDYCTKRAPKCEKCPLAQMCLSVDSDGQI